MSREGTAIATMKHKMGATGGICTPATGSVVQDGGNGFTVCVQGNLLLIVERLELLLGNRNRLAEMSFAARNSANEFTIAAYRQRLLHVLTHSVDPLYISK